MAELRAAGPEAERISQLVGTDGPAQVVEVWPGWSVEVRGWNETEFGSEDNPEDPLRTGVLVPIYEAPEWLWPAPGGEVYLQRHFADGGWIEAAAYWLRDT